MTTFDDLQATLQTAQTQATELSTHDSDLSQQNDSLQTSLGEANAKIAALQAQVVEVPETYVVQSGDTLLKIGRKYKVQTLDIMSWNGLTSDLIKPGQTLYLTGPAPAPQPDPVPQKSSTVFSWDISNLGSDAKLSDTEKISSHKKLFGVDNIQNVRVFFGGSDPSWSNPRCQALTEKDSLVISFNKFNRATFKTLLANTPDRFTKRPSQVKFCYKHEFEAEWRDSSNQAAWVKDYLAVYQAMAEELDASKFDSQSKDDVVRIFLWYSQVIDAKIKGKWQQFIGGQKFGLVGMDCYNYQVWLGKGRYATPEELFGPLVQMGKTAGLPVCAPEWGGEIANGDDGTKWAQAIAAQGKFAQDNGLVYANWWCAVGSKDAKTGLPRNHHVEQSPAATAVMKKLVQG